MRHTLAIILLAAVLACRKDQPPAELNMADEPGLRPLPADAVIRVIRTPCYGACPVFSLTLLESGEVIFEGKANVRFVGRVSKHVDPSCPHARFKIPEIRVSTDGNLLLEWAP